MPGLLPVNSHPIFMNATPEELAALACKVGHDWKQGSYYDEAERDMDYYWAAEVWPYIFDFDLRVTMDLAAGHGRNSARLLPLVERLHIVDINEENIAFCQKRFGNNPKISYSVTSGFELADIPDNTLTAVYCYDAMVHFDSDIVRAYLGSFMRALQPGGRGFCHHSNYTDNPCGDVHENPAWRNYMSKSLFAHYCHKEGLVVESQHLIRDHDCITVFRRPQPKAVTADLPAPAM